MEQIKQEIINNIYENGENLITGPILQTVLLDMVDDVNDKVASASAAVPSDLVEKTGSWDDAADWVEQNSSSVVLQPDLDGYATEQWVEDQGYLKEIPEGYATTESLNDLSESVAQDFSNLDIPDTSGLATTESVNQLSESVAQSIADIPAPDLSNYATKPELNEATESVKDWVEAKHYLTSASLSGSVTEETVGFMINDATASVKNWVENQDYATETFVSQAIAEIPGTDLTGYATEQWVEDQGYLKDHQDISGLATTESVTSLSESVAQDFANLNIPDVSGLATTSSVNQLSESVAQTIEDLPQPDLSGYLQTSSYLVDSASFDQRINNITGSEADLSGYATTSSLNQLSESVAGDIESLTNSLDGVNQGIEEVSNSLANYLTTESANQLSASFDQRISEITGSDLSGYLQTSSYLVDSASFDSRINNALQTAGQAIEDLGINLNSLSSSVAEDFDNLNIPDVSGYATTQSVNALSASFAETIDNIPGTDLSGYATEQWVENQGYLTEHQDISGLATTSSLNSVSQSLSASIAAVTGSSVDLSGYATTASLESNTNPDNSVAIFLNSIGLAQWDSDNDEWHYNLEDAVDNDPNDPFYQRLSWLGLVYWQEEPDPQWLPYGSFEDISRIIRDLQESGSFLMGENDNYSLNAPTLRDYENTSASFDQRISSITSSGGSGVDTDLRNFLFGVETQTLTGITGSVTNIYSNVSSDTTLGFNAVPDNGKSLGITIHNVGTDDVAVTLPDSIVVNGTTYNLINNGIDNSGSMSIPASEYGDIVITRNGTDLFVRTSIDVSNISGSSTPVDLSGYATTESVNTAVGQVDTRVTNLSASFDQRINDIPGSDIDLSEYATTASVNTLSASFAETIDNIPGGGASGDYLPLTGGTLTGNLKVNASVGIGVNPEGSNSLAVGEGTTTYGAYNSVAVGESCRVSVYDGFAAGRENVIEGNGAFGMATGFRNRVNKMAGYAGGCLSTASGEFATAIGFGAEAAAKGQVVLGAFNEVDRSNGTGSYAVILANGKSSTWNQDNPGDITRSNGLAIKWDGGIDINYSGSTITLQDKLAELEAGPGDGYVTTESLNEALSEVGVWVRGEGSGSAKLSGSLGRATGNYAVVMGGPNVASGYASVAEGLYTTASGYHSHAEGHLSQATSNASHAEGQGTARGSYSHAENGGVAVGAWSHAENRAIAVGERSHAEGDYAVASGSYSHAEGSYTTASGEYSHAEGNRTHAEGIGSHAEGHLTSASGEYSHAEGRITTSSGDFSHAEGHYTIATGRGSHAEGGFTVADNEYEHASGRNNFTSPNQIFSVGVGKDQGRNAISIITGSYGSSSVYIQGVGSYNGRNPEPGVNDIATVINSIAGGSPADLSGYVTTQSINNLSASFDQRIDEIVASSGGVDPSNFAKAPSVIYQTDGSTGLVGVNMTSSTAYVISDEAWQLENLDLSTFDRIDCYFKHSSPRIVTVVLDDVTLDSTFGAYVEKASVMTLNVKPSSGDTVKRSDLTRKWVAVDSTKTKLQVAVNTDTSDLLYKIVGYPKLV